MNTSAQLPIAFYKEIRQLLRRSHAPRVKIQKSLAAPAAGEGVFVCVNNVESGTPLCLYPGIYTPPLPRLAITDDTIVYMGNQLPPSAVLPEDNAYIINLRETGGYVDALALECCPDDAFRSNHRFQKLDENPSACAHKINHSPRRHNSEIVPFFWSDVILDDECADEFFPFPNASRADDTPWYFDGRTNTMHYYTAKGAALRPLCGAAACSTHNLQPGEELYLDYDLKCPYPAWAVGWYEQAASPC